MMNYKVYLYILIIDIPAITNDFILTFDIMFS